MFKKVVIATLLLSSILFSSDDSSNNSSSPTDMLTGDTKLACEAILCLSSGQRPDECNESIQKYFSIKAKKPQDTIKARQNFLNLCPVDGADKKDEKFADLRDNVLPMTDGRECTAEALNQRIEANSYESLGKYYTAYRVNPTVPSQCNSLYNHSYTDIKRPIYKCTGEFYSQLEWDLSSKLQQISYSEYRNLSSNLQHTIYYSDSDSGGYAVYYKKVPFSKTCWFRN
jgi:hypothetical protein